MWYNGNKLLNMRDKNGNKPEILISIGNRSIGKTFYFNSFLLKNFIKNKEQFILIYRHNYELKDVASAFFDDIKIKFSNYEMTEKSRARGLYLDLLLNDDVCGYALSLFSYEKIKKHAHIFKNVKYMLFDEFQSESDDYLKNEISAFISLHTSVARGGGSAVRFVPVIMISNAVSLLNPYFNTLKISSKIQHKTKYLRGNGFIFEKTLNTEISKQQKESLFNTALSGEKEINYLSENVYLNDNNCLIEKIRGDKKYIATLLYNDKKYGIFKTSDFIYISKSYDDNCIRSYAATYNDLNENHTICDLFTLNIFRNKYKNGLLRFQNLKCKESFLQFIKY